MIQGQGSPARGESSRRPYAQPRLLRFGHVSELTQNQVAGMNSDSAGMQPNKKS
jgi:hypothetical protein